MACLSSRIPTGIEVTHERLTRIQRAEALLRSWGFDHVTLDLHGYRTGSVSPEGEVEPEAGEHEPVVADVFEQAYPQ
jgi:uncharacterized protein